MHTHTIGDTPVITGTVGADITDTTARSALIERPDGSVRTTTNVVVIPDTTSGFAANFTESDLEQEGWHKLEVTVTFANSVEKTYVYDADGSELGFEVRKHYGA